MRIKQQGIFQVKNLVNNKIYIGSSQDIDRIFSQFKSTLNKGTHNNAKLQSDWYMHKKEKFEFSILEQVHDKSCMYEKIQKYLDELLPYGECGYNNKKKLKNLVCSICNCTKEESSSMIGPDNKFGIILCKKHYRQIEEHNKIIDASKPSIRNRNKRNEIISHGDYAEICMYNNKGIEVARAIVDLDDVDKCKEFKWSLDGDGYPKSQGKGLHNLIYSVEDGYLVDHIDRDKLNNRKINLRQATPCDNTHNRSVSSRNTSGCTGVNWDSQIHKWWARIQTNGVRRVIGYYSLLEDAIKARKEAELEEWKEFSPLDNIEKLDNERKGKNVKQ